MDGAVEQLEERAMGTLAYGLARLDLGRVRQCLVQNPDCLSSFPHNPFLHCARGATVENDAGVATPLQLDAQLVAQFELIEPFATDAQKTDLRRACEMCLGLGCVEAGMWLLDHGASMTNQIGSYILRALREHSGHLDGKRLQSWKRGPTMKVEQWKHEILAVASFAGVDPALIDQAYRDLHCQFNSKRMARAVVRAVEMEATAWITRSLEEQVHHIRATSASLMWLDDKFHGRLGKALDEMGKPLDLFAKDYRSLLDRGRIEMATPAAAASPRHMRI